MAFADVLLRSPGFWLSPKAVWLSPAHFLYSVRGSVLGFAKCAQVAVRAAPAGRLPGGRFFVLATGSVHLGGEGNFWAFERAALGGEDAGASHVHRVFGHPAGQPVNACVSPGGEAVALCSGFGGCVG